MKTSKSELKQAYIDFLDSAGFMLVLKGRNSF